MRTTWTEEEIEILRHNYALPNGPEIIEGETGFSYRQIISKAKRIGIRRGKKGDYKTKGLLKEFVVGQRLIEQLKTWKCPGKVAYCGLKLTAQIVFSEEGYSTELFDLVCPVGHRFPIPGKKKGGGREWFFQ